MNTPVPMNTCRQCGGPMASNAPEGLCARCLLSVAMKGPEPADAAEDPPNGPAASPGSSDIIDIGDPAEVAKKLPQFEILEMLGRGGMGVVYKARQRNLDRIVALKILPPVDALSPDFVARFTREARSLAKLNHPNIVNVHDFGETGGLYYIVMEYVDGMNLRQLLQTRQFTPAEALAIVPKICDALQYAHEEGLVHRDIKPENLLIDKKGRVKIADFGLAKLLRREPLDMTLTLSGMALGTLRYMAPEQMDKPETVDHRADLYSLGVVIYEMLTGEVPVGRFELPSQKAQVDVRLDEIVLHALEKEPARRYQHASEIRTDVQHVTDQPKPATEVIQPARAVAADPGRIAEAKRDALDPLPRSFWLRSFGALTLGWFALVALWTFGLTGFVLGSVVMGAIVLEIGRSHANRNPLWVEKLRKRSTWSLFPTLFFNLSMLVLLLMMFLSGLFMAWDSSENLKNHLAPTREDFEAQYKGKEYQLIRRLDAFKEKVPAVELTNTLSNDSFEKGRERFDGWFYVVLSLLGLFHFFQQAAGRLANADWKLRRGGWWPALACTGTFLGSLACAYVTLSLCWDSGSRIVAGVNTFFMTPASVQQVSTALERWAAENGYADASNRWSVQTVPKGEQVATVEVFGALKASPLERWRMTTAGPERPFPHIAVQVVSSEKPAQSDIHIDCGFDMASLVEVSSAKHKEWDAIIQSLGAAVRNAPDIDLTKPIENPAVKKTETSLNWPGLWGVFGAMLVWVFLRARTLRIAPPSSPKRRFRDLHPKIRRRVIWQFAGLAVAGIVAPTAIEFLIQLVVPHAAPVRGIYTEECYLWPHSKAYEKLYLTMPYYSDSIGGNEDYRRPNQWHMSIGIKTKGEEKPQIMEIDMPSLKASYFPKWSKDWPTSMVLDIDELTTWLRDRCGVDVKDPAVQKEAAEVMALLKQFSRQAPANTWENMVAREAQLKSFDMGGSRPSGGAFFQGFSWQPSSIVPISISALVFLAGFVAIVRVMKAAFALDREVRERGEGVLTSGPLPRVRFRDLPPDLRRRTVWSMAVGAVVLLGAPSAIVWMRTPLPHTRETVHYGFLSDSKNFSGVTMTCAFERYQRDGETYLVDPRVLPLELAFTFSDGTKRTLTVELPSLRATWLASARGASGSVVLDTEELARWMRNVPAQFSDTAPMDSDSADLIGFLKQFGTRPPSTEDELARLAKLQHFHISGSTRETARPAVVSSTAFLPVLAGLIAVFVGLLFFLKRSAVRAALRQEQ